MQEHTHEYVQHACNTSATRCNGRAEPVVTIAFIIQSLFPLLAEKWTTHRCASGWMTDASCNNRAEPVVTIAQTRCNDRAEPVATIEQTRCNDRAEPVLTT